MLLLDMDPALPCDGPLDPATFVSPAESASAPPSFNASWSPSKTAALGPTNLPVAKTPRAWDRKPCNPSAEQSRIKKVWKRYELRAQPQTQQAPTKTNNGERPHLEKVVKRLRLQSPRNDGETSPSSKASYAPTMWERRRSRGTGRKRPKQSPAPSDPQTMTKNPSAESNMQIKAAPNHSDGAVPAAEVSQCDNVRLGECEGNQLPALQESLLLDTSGVATSDVTEVAGTETKNKASMVELDPNSCIPSVAKPSLLTSDTSITSPPEINSESEEQVDELSAGIVSEEHSENPVVSGESLSNDGLNDSAVLPVQVKTGDGDIAPNETERVPPLTSENQTAALPADVPDGETIIDDQRYLGSPLLELCRPPISPISPAVKASQSPSAMEPNGEPDLADVCNNSSSPAQVQTAANTPLINDTPTKVSDQDSPDDEDATTQFDDDKEKLKSFLLRIQANKANKQISLSRRESLQNRRDSDVVRKALTSPRPALEEKDANTSSPTRVPSLYELSKQLESVINDVEDRDVTASQPAADGHQDISSGSPNLRRSTRKQSRIPQLPTASTAARTPRKINVRRTDGNETLVLAAKREAMVFAQLTRTNTRKNKGGAIPAPQRLTQLTPGSPVLSPTVADRQQPRQDSANTQEESNEQNQKRTTVHWDEKLTYFKAAPVSTASPTTTSHESGGSTQPTQGLTTPQRKKTSTSRVRRLKGLGAANGTPAKGLLSSTLLPDEQEEAAASGENERLINKPRNAALAKNKPDRKSKLAAPKKLELKPNVASVVGPPAEGKENVTRLHVTSPRKGPFGGGRVLIPVAAAGDGPMAVVPTRTRAAKKI